MKQDRAAGIQWGHSPAGHVGVAWERGSEEPLKGCFLPMGLLTFPSKSFPGLSCTEYKTAKEYSIGSSFQFHLIVL